MGDMEMNIGTEVPVEDTMITEVAETPVVSDSMKLTTAAGLGALAGITGGALVQGCVCLWKNVVKPKVATFKEQRKAKKAAAATVNNAVPELDTGDDFPEFNEENLEK